MSLNQCLIDIGAATGEAAGILDIPFLRAAHQRRQRIIEAIGSASLDGRSTTPERLFAWLGEIPIQMQANLGAEGYAAEVFSALVAIHAQSPLGREAVELFRRAREAAGRDPLLAAANLFRGPDAVTPASRAAFYHFLADALGPAQPAISPLLGGVEAAAKRPLAVFEAYMAERLAKASRRALANARTLRAGLSAVYNVLGKARASSHVHEIAELLFAGHPLNIAQVGRIFGISRLTARKHLLRLQADGLAELATRGKTGRIFIARDGLITFGQASLTPPPRANGRLAVSTSRPLSDQERARLVEVTDEVAGRMADLDRLLRRLDDRAQ
jgi:hypothetical protein